MQLYKNKIEQLHSLQYDVTINNGTEPAFKNLYWDHKKEGIYVDIISGEALFSSKDKYDSGTGWPSFSQHLLGSQILVKQDNSHGMSRSEVRSIISHLGHVFDDGPEGKKRYCINSASLDFISKDNLIESGYGDYRYLFDSDTQPINTAYIGGGCFWGIEYEMAKIPGVVNTKVGYSGGNKETAHYQVLCSGNTGHAEVVEVSFDQNKIHYNQIIRLFLMLHDPTTKNQQGSDIGSQYRSVVFHQNDIEKNIILHMIQRANIAGVYDNEIVTEVTELEKFHLAEDYHQKYLQNNPNGYHCHFFREGWNF